MFPASAGDDLVVILTGEGLVAVLTEEVLVVILASVVLVPVLPSHWVHAGLGELGDHVRPVDDIEGHRHLLSRSEVTTSH